MPGWSTWRISDVQLLRLGLGRWRLPAYRSDLLPQLPRCIVRSRGCNPGCLSRSRGFHDAMRCDATRCDAMPPPCWFRARGPQSQFSRLASGPTGTAVGAAALGRSVVELAFAAASMLVLGHAGVRRHGTAGRHAGDERLTAVPQHGMTASVARTVPTARVSASASVLASHRLAPAGCLCERVRVYVRWPVLSHDAHARVWDLACVECVSRSHDPTHSALTGPFRFTCTGWRRTKQTASLPIASRQAGQAQLPNSRPMINCWSIGWCCLGQAQPRTPWTLGR